MSNKSIIFLVGLIFVCIILGVLTRLIIIPELKADLSPLGTPDDFGLGFFIKILIILETFIALITGLIAIAIKRTRVIGIFVLCASFSYLGAFKIYNPISWNEEACNKLEYQLTPLIRAIEQYKIEKGEYPKELENLLPQYISELPSTDMGNYSKYEYDLGERGSFRGDNPWRLFVYSRHGIGSKFVYYPIQKEWIYFHD